MRTPSRPEPPKPRTCASLVEEVAQRPSRNSRTGASLVEEVALRVQDGECEPEVLEGDRPSRLVWSSLWPDRPDDRVEFTLASRGPDTLLGIVVVADQDTEPDQASQIRHRLGQLIYSELRHSYGG